MSLTNQSAKTAPEKSISDILITFTSSFCNYLTIDAHAIVKVLPFSPEKVLKNNDKKRT